MIIFFIFQDILKLYISMNAAFISYWNIVIIVFHGFLVDPMYRSIYQFIDR